ncbi:hypothetical protein [Pseudodonghicola flavimaris]|uniref:Uncharacterized protein n=1 Tax=Pseudodonghicola flavimaris TaxID=3050036 RepID=A0ABT7F4B1_9RHOB|nr:hypothetical protein [Pseudodonghicola flavimaris]MDK3019447.1 hypothetical protein [Pseudodonghicola flavimaris]
MHLYVAETDHLGRVTHVWAQKAPHERASPVNMRCDGLDHASPLQHAEVSGATKEEIEQWLLKARG